MSNQTPYPELPAVTIPSLNAAVMETTPVNEEALGDNTNYAALEPSSGKTKKSTKEKEGPVKAACLACRGKKAKCDGVRPRCGTVRYASPFFG